MLANSIVIAGGIKGLGFEIGKHFLLNSELYLCIIDKELDQENEEFLKINFPGRFSLFNCDLAVITETEAVAAQINTRYHPVILVNNLGPRSNIGMMEETGMVFTQLLETIVTSNFLLSRAFLQNAKDKSIDRFRIVNIGSVLGDLVGPQSPGYHVAKGALQSLTRYFSIQGKSYVSDLSVILLQIGFIVQNHHRERYDAPNNLDFRNIISQYQGSSYVFSSEDVASSLFALSMSESASLINGNVINLDYGCKNKEQLDSLFSLQNYDD